jgi:uncharacterized protein YciI
MFIVSLTYIQPLQQVEALLAQHIEWLKEGYATGVFLASGRKIPRDGGVILARTATRQALEQWLDLDPFSQNGVARYDIIEFTPTMTAPGLDALNESGLA